MPYKQSERNMDIENQLIVGKYSLDKFVGCRVGEHYDCSGIIGIPDERLSYVLLELFSGRLQVYNEIPEKEYCKELKEIIERGYFEVSYCGGAFIRRVNVPKDWKPTVMTYFEPCSDEDEHFWELNRRKKRKL